MTTRTVAGSAGTTASEPALFEQFAGLCAILAGGAGFLYAVSFVVLRSNLLSALVLLLGGLLSTAALVAVYRRLRETEPAFALWAVILAVTGAIGSVIHGGYDLANVVHPPTTSTDLPSPIDPRGLLTFGVAGVGLLAIAWLMGRGSAFPRGLGQLGYALAVLLVALYVSRLFILDTKNPLVVVLALLSGFLANPIWYVWLGLVLRSGRRA